MNFKISRQQNKNCVGEDLPVQQKDYDNSFLMGTLLSRLLSSLAGTLQARYCPCVCRSVTNLNHCLLFTVFPLTIPSLLSQEEGDKIDHLSSILPAIGCCLTLAGAKGSLSYLFEAAPRLLMFMDASEYTQKVSF